MAKKEGLSSFLASYYFSRMKAYCLYMPLGSISMC